MKRKSKWERRRTHRKANNLIKAYNFTQRGPSKDDSEEFSYKEYRLEVRRFHKTIQQLVL